jgi:CTP synthase (UTP-ammonia lyase)
MAAIRIGLVGNYNPTVPAHQAIPIALRLAGQTLACDVEGIWLETETIQGDVAALLGDFTAIWCVPNSPYKSMDGALAAIRFARESGRPFLGTCGGFQHALIEYARNVLGLSEASHAESDPDANFALISPLSCSLVEKHGEIILEDQSRLREFYGASTVSEEYHCNYGLNPQFEQLFATTPLHICGRDTAGEVRVVELTDHPFFFATLFQPERSALRVQKHPLIRAYVQAAVQQREGAR